MRRKKQNLILSILLSAFVLVACGGGGGGGSDDDDSGGGDDREEEKNLFSRWVDTDDGTVLDFRGMTFDTVFPFNFSFDSGEVCQCGLIFRGNQSEGTITLANCVYLGGGNGDPNCPAIFENNGEPYDYANENAELSICNAGNSCDEYR